MKKHMLLAATIWGWAATNHAASTIVTGFQQAYAANFGWVNCKWDSSTPEGLVVNPSILSGEAYSANVGWLDFGDGTPTGSTGKYQQTGGDIGVNHDGAGNLSGYAYGANIGWIYFDPTIAQPPRIDLMTGRFSGYVYSANLGWIYLGGLKTTLAVLADTDAGGVGDGIADNWELERLTTAGLGSNLNLLGSTPNADFDQDGVSDADEYLADTNPFSANDRFSVTHFDFDAGNGNVDIDWNGSERRTYTIYCSPDLRNWAPVGTTQTGSSAGFTLSGAAHLFFRVEVGLPLSGP